MMNKKRLNYACNVLASIFISNFTQRLYQAGIIYCSGFILRLNYRKFKISFPMIYNKYIVLVHFKQYQEINQITTM